jgi:biotin transport system substrate-specific component
MEIVEKYRSARYNAFRWRYECSYLYKLVLALGMACFTGLCAQLRFYLPWTPVPVTAQTFAVLLSGILLGRLGGLSQGFYASIGAAGIPWFAGGKGGISVLTGATGGYIIGFIFASLFVGHLVDKYRRSRRFLSLFLLLLVANFLIIHTLGLIQLYFWLSLFKTSPGIIELLFLGTIPFIPGDLAKIGIVAGISTMVLPKEAYNGEVD